MLKPILKLADPSNYKVGRTSKIKYIVIHYTANNGDTAAGNANYFASNKKLQASAHYFVDEKEIYNAVKEADTAWHCGGAHYVSPTCRNYNSIGIELCSRKDSKGNYYFKDATVSNAVSLVKALMAKYGIDADHVIRHYDVTGKNCPAPFVEDANKWNAFKAKLQEAEKVEKKTLNIVMPDGKVFSTLAINDNGSNYTQIRPLLEALGYKVGFINGKVTIKK